MGGPQRDTPKIDRGRRRTRTQQWVAKPRVGDQLGSFRLLQLLGEGGAGAVYRAEHTFLKRPVAIKVLHPELYLRPAMVARFFQEALAVNRARHRNIIDITDVVASESFPPFIVMELLEGEDLGDHIDKFAPLPLSLTLSISRQICAALAVVHKLDIVHRDLKPENIFLVKADEDVEDKTPTVKLLDFGIAKFIDNEENRRRTWSGNVLGTPAYMPLEQLHGLPVDARADIYALGVVIYEMLTGRLPFEIDGVEDLADGALLLTPPPPSQRTIRPPPEPIPAGIDAVVLKCLSDSPVKRYQSVEELSAALKQAAVADGVPVLDQPRRKSSRSLKAVKPPEAGGLAPDVRAAEAPPGDAGAALPRLGEAADPARRRLDSTSPAVHAIPRLPSDQGAEAPAQAARAPRSRRLVLGLLAVGALAGLAAGAWGLWGRRDGSSRPPTRTAGHGADAMATAARVELISVPPRAQILRADTGALIGQTPTALPVTDTPQVLVLRVDGFKEQRVTLRRGGPNPVRIWLEAEPRPAPLRATAPPDPRAPMDRPREPPVRIKVVHVAAPARRATPRPPPRAMVTEQGIVDPFKK